MARARGFMGEAHADNAAFQKDHPPPFFTPMLKEQRPRATVLMCSDSRVQLSAFDATPENDLFVVRNIGNQVETSQGSLEYGVSELKTPVLVILGHTGCGAIHAAMGEHPLHRDAIQREVEGLRLPTELKKAKDPKVWTEAVVHNVNHQVARSIELFSAELARGDLTIVGAVYDLQNAYRKGHGKFIVINVNGQTNAARVEGFVRAVGASAPVSTTSDAPTSILKRDSSDPRPLASVKFR